MPSHCAALSSPCHTSCHTASCRPLVALPSCQLIAPACCRIASSRPRAALSSLVLSSRQLVVASPLDVPPSHSLVVSLSRHAASCCLVAPAGCCAIISCRPLVAPPSSGPLIVLAGCCVACSCTALLSSRRSPLPTPSNAVERCCRHQTPLPPPPLNAVSITHRCHSCRPSPPSNANAHLRPSPLSNADARRRHLPPLMSISIVASPSPIPSPHPRRVKRCRRH